MIQSAAAGACVNDIYTHGLHRGAKDPLSLIFFLDYGPLSVSVWTGKRALVSLRPLFAFILTPYTWVLAASLLLFFAVVHKMNF